ncbi:hypothetical protein J6590_008737 [Homalodisca vitripennis]|nr:hypothetical protein J6590_008737 [Homalodisca vitripennis]
MGRTRSIGNPPQVRCKLAAQPGELYGQDAEYWTPSTDIKQAQENVSKLHIQQLISSFVSMTRFKVQDFQVILTKFDETDSTRNT